jgi:hypothetical protein
MPEWGWWLVGYAVFVALFVWTWGRFVRRMEMRGEW